MPDPPRILLIGLGNDFRSDDRVGLEVARRLQADRLPGVEVMIGVADALELIDHWDQADLVILVDCAVSGSEPGKVHRFNTGSDPIPEDLFSRFSTHAFSVVDTLALAAALGRSPSRLIVYGIEAETCIPGTGLSVPVQHAADQLTGRIRNEIATFSLPAE